MSLCIRFNGTTARAVYNDHLAPTLAQLDAGYVVKRASHVEPAEGGGWSADMAPSGGGVLGPFPLRQDALDAERAWLKTHHGI